MARSLDYGFILHKYIVSIFLNNIFSTINYNLNNISHKKNKSETLYARLFIYITSLYFFLLA